MERELFSGAIISSGEGAEGSHFCDTEKSDKWSIIQQPRRVRPSYRAQMKALFTSFYLLCRLSPCSKYSLRYERQSSVLGGQPPHGARWREGRGQRREEGAWQAPRPGLGAARGSMRDSGRASAASCCRHFAQLREGRIFGARSPTFMAQWRRNQGGDGHEFWQSA